MALSAGIETAEFEFLVNPLSASGRPSIPLEPPTTAVKARFGALSHEGKVRARNEDHFMVAKIRRNLDVLSTNLSCVDVPNGLGEDAYSMVVADGMGGMNAGDIASMMAISTGMRLADKTVKWGFKINEKEARELLVRLNAYFCEIDRRLTEKSETDRKLFGMGTTMTLAYSAGVHLFLVHVGDSRCYLFRKGQLNQLTRDHTVAQALADAGEIRREDIRKHSRRNTLTNYLGGHRGKIKADVRWLRLEDEDRLLLCSDGLSDMVDDAEIAGCLATHEEPDIATNSLVQLALDHGGKDNVTVVVARYTVPSPTQLHPPLAQTSDLPCPDLLEETAEHDQPGLGR